MSREVYYTRYEDRYRTAYKEGVELWGHSPNNKELVTTLTDWVNKNNLKGRKIIEFACGEGASGVILSELGCIYHGVDIAPSAINKAKKLLAGYDNAKVSLLDMVNETVEDKYDAALDVMGLHMIVTDSDRKKYIDNALATLKNSAPMLFYHESYRDDSYDGVVESIDDWYKINDMDYFTPQKREVTVEDKTKEIYVPTLPARAKSKRLYIEEMTSVGFDLDQFQLNGDTDEIYNSANIYVHKPNK